MVLASFRILFYSHCPVQFLSQTGGHDDEIQKKIG